MTTEDKLKGLILKKYHSVREFALTHDIPYTTIHSIFRRGIGNSSVSNIVKICKALGISTDALADGEIKAIDDKSAKLIADDLDLEELIDDSKEFLKHDKSIKLNGQPLAKSEIDSLIDTIDIGVEMIKKKR